MKTKRHAKILEIIQRESVDTQEELLRLLRQEGVQATQATVSRDIKELRIVKTLTVEGTYRYAVPGTTVQEGSRERFYSLFSQSVTGVDFAINIVVVKCHNGMAQAVCAAMDALHWTNVMATLAGDDTFLCITKSEEYAVGLTSELKKLLKPDKIGG